MKKLQQVPLMVKRSQAFHKQLKNGCFKHLDTPISEEKEAINTHSLRSAVCC